MTLEELRTDIDRIDERILALLAQRMEKALLTSSFKNGLTKDEAREEAVIARARRPSRRLVSPDFAAELYARIIEESRGLQEQELATIAFQGDHGAWSEAAALAWDPEIAAIPCREFVDVFEAVQEGRVDYGIVPVENTLGGLVGPVNAILVYADLDIVGAVDLPIRHCLVAIPGVDHREIRQAYSHNQALAQCRGFLARNRLDPLPYYDTAGAARMIAEERPRTAAALASRLAAELYGLDIIKEGVQDAENNRTRFFVLKRKGETAALPALKRGPSAGTKCSAVFHAEDKAGGLFGVLEIFAKDNINLTRIESVPDTPGDYAIFIDFDGSVDEPRVADAISAASASARGFRLLGCYEEKRI
jgi:prephenate dehydratase/chorismate mutase/prephenate dehydratase